MITKDGYIIAIEQTDEKYAEVIAKIETRPEAPEGYTYKLSASTLEWELVEISPEPPEPDDPDPEEALAILLGEEEA